MSERTCDFCEGTFCDGVACYVFEQAVECNRAPAAKRELLRRRLTDPVGEPVPTPPVAPNLAQGGETP